MSEQRKHYPAPDKVAILRLHLLEKKPVSDLCDQFGIHPTLFYRWQKEFFENGAAAFVVHRQTPQNRRRSQGPQNRCLGGEASTEERSLGGSDAGVRPTKKRTWGALKGVWVPHDTRDRIVDFVNRWSSKTGIAVFCLLLWLGLGTSKWHDWKKRYGKVNEHNAWIPAHDHWLEGTEKQAILEFHDRYPLEGYRRLTFMMLDADVVAASPSSVYRVLKAAGLLEKHNIKPSKERVGFYPTRCDRTNTGMWTCRTSTSPGRFTTCVASSTVVAARSSTGKSGKP